MITIKIELFLSPLNLLVVIEVSLGTEYWIPITIFLLVLPNRELRVFIIDMLIILSVHRHCGIGSNVLSQSFFDNSLHSKFFTWLHQHLSCCPTVLYKLEEGIVYKCNALL